MNRFARLRDRLGYAPSRNNKLRLMGEYFRTTPDPERGWALAALTGVLSFQHAQPNLIRALIASRVDPYLIDLSYDYVGDLSETVALLWPAPPPAGDDHESPTLSAVVLGLATVGKLGLPALIAGWLDRLDETGRWALLKLITGALRVGVSAPLAQTAVAAGTPVGLEAKAIMERGDLVPDAVVVGIVAERVEAPDASHGFILDGFPRTVAQATALDAMLADKALRLDAVIEFKVDEAALVGRITRRAEETAARGEPVRKDDSPDVFRTRLEAYRVQTAPLSDYYHRTGLLRTLDGMRPIDEVTGALHGLLVPYAAEAMRA